MTESPKEGKSGVKVLKPLFAARTGIISTAVVSLADRPSFEVISVAKYFRM